MDCDLERKNGAPFYGWKGRVWGQVGDDGRAVHRHHHENSRSAVALSHLHAQQDGQSAQYIAKENGEPEEFFSMPLRSIVPY